MSMVSSIDYDIMHRRFAHPSMDVLRHASGNTQGFPNISIPKENPICPGCAEGKMTKLSFPASDHRSTKPFDKVHMDLKSMPTHSYHGYNFFLILYDDCTSHGWTVSLKHKSDADLAIWQFIALIKTQYGKIIHEFQIDAGGEFKSKELTEFLKELSVNILTSVPHMHQQNGCAERFIRTIMDKSQAICLESCAPQSWWEFAVDCAVHVYNCTPIQRHNWKMPVENLTHTKPDVTHFRVFGCGAYVFLPEEVRHNKLNPRSELMTFIGYPQGVKGYLFMRSLNNMLFTAVQALFDETLYPKCPDMHRPGYTPDPDRPVSDQGEYNIPPDDDESDRNGGGPPFPIGPGGGHGNQYMPPQPPMPPHQPQQGYPPLPPSPSNHSYPSPQVRSNAPSLSLNMSPQPSWLATPPSPPYDKNFFTSYQDYQDWLQARANARPPTPETEEVRQRKIKETLKHWGYGTNWRGVQPPTQFTDDGHLIPPLIPNPTLPNDPAVQPQEDPSGSQLRRSGRTRQPVIHPDNIYGNQNPIDSEQMSNQGFQRLIVGVPVPSGSSNRPKSPLSEGKGKQRADHLARIVQEGDAGLINFLLSAAVKPTDGAGGKLPNVHNVREWHYRDLMRFPEAVRKEWKTACPEELESLQKHSVFKLTDLPKGHKTIGCRWVFDVKSDGQKKARLVAQGYSQAEGVDFNELFSPVVRFESVRIIFTLAALNGWYMTRVDVRMAYLYGKLDEEIYMRQPEGFVTTGQENKVIRLQ